MRKPRHQSYSAVTPQKQRDPTGNANLLCVAQQRPVAGLPDVSERAAGTASVALGLCTKVQGGADSANPKKGLALAPP